MNREQIERWLAALVAMQMEARARDCGLKICDDAIDELRSALRSLESAEPVVRVITGDDEKFWAGDRRAEQKRMQEQFNASFQTYASAPAAAPEAVSVPKKEWEDALAQLSTLKDGIREIDGQFVLCWTQEQVDLAKKRGAELHDRLAAAKEGKP